MGIAFTLDMKKIRSKLIYCLIFLSFTNLQGGKVVFSNVLTENTSISPRPITWSTLESNTLISASSDYYVGLNIKSPEGDDWNLVCFSSVIGFGFFNAGPVDLEGYPEDLPLKAYLSVWQKKFGLDIGSAASQCITYDEFMHVRDLQTYRSSKIFELTIPSKSTTYLLNENTSDGFSFEVLTSVLPYLCGDEPVFHEGNKYNPVNLLNKTSEGVGGFLVLYFAKNNIGNQSWTPVIQVSMVDLNQNLKVAELIKYDPSWLPKNESIFFRTQIFETEKSDVPVLSEVNNVFILKNFQGLNYNR